MMQYTDVIALDEAIITAMQGSTLLQCKMPQLPSSLDFVSTIELYKRWCVGREESAHIGLKSMTDSALKAYLQVDILHCYMVALGQLVDSTPHLQTLLELLEVMPEASSPDPVRRSNAPAALYST